MMACKVHLPGLRAQRVAKLKTQDSYSYKTWPPGCTFPVETASHRCLSSIVSMLKNRIQHAMTLVLDMFRMKITLGLLKKS